MNILMKVFLGIVVVLAFITLTIFVLVKILGLLISGIGNGLLTLLEKFLDSVLAYSRAKEQAAADMKRRKRNAHLPCCAVQCSDQMVCACGNGWDVNDPYPPECQKEKLP